MKNETIYEAFQRIQPDEQTRERMLARILSTSELERQEVSQPRRRRGTRRVVLLAAALGAVLGLTVAAAAYGTDFFGLLNVDMGPTELNIPEVEEDGTIEYYTEERDVISYQGLAGSPEYLANAEWQEFLETYDQDRALLAAVGNSPTGIPEDYDAYTCYTWEMAEKIDEICGKYGLRLLGPAVVEEDMQGLFRQSGAGDVCAGNASGAVNTAYSGYRYQDGTFHFEGAVVRDGQTTDYQFSRTMRGSFSTLALYLSDIEDYRQWTYTTKNGVPLLLANNSTSKALVIADLEQSFVVVNVLGDWMNDSFSMTDQDVEDFAESFDFTAIP